MPLTLYGVLALSELWLKLFMVGIILFPPDWLYEKEEAKFVDPGMVDLWADYLMFLKASILFMPSN